MTGFIDTSLQLESIITARNQWFSTTRSIPCWTTSVFSSTVTNDERRITAHTLNSSESVILRLTVSQSVSLGVEPHLGLMTGYLLLFDNYGFVLVGRRVCLLYMLLALASVVFLWPESLGTSDHIVARCAPAAATVQVSLLTPTCHVSWCPWQVINARV
jgi:hypothetical protein